MGCCSSCQQACCICGFTELREGDFGCSLVGSLMSTADAVRDIATQLGARPYIVTLVWSRWSGGERGMGNEEVVKTQKLLPTPLVETLSTVDQRLESIGLAESGTLKVTEISPRYSEDLLNGQDVIVPPGQKLPLDVNFSWVVTFIPSRINRRFTPTRVMNFMATNLEWQVHLMRSSDDLPRGFLT